MKIEQNLYDVSNVDLNDSEVVIIDIYIYYDGSHTSVNTNNVANLAGADISLKFDVTVKNS